NAKSVTFGITADPDTGAPLESITCDFTKGATTIWDDNCPPTGTFDADMGDVALQPLTDGSYTLVVTATDAAGNVSTATRNFVVDRTAPLARITGLASLTGPLTLAYPETVSGLPAGAV